MLGSTEGNGILSPDQKKSMLGLTEENEILFPVAKSSCLVPQRKKAPFPWPKLHWEGEIFPFARGTHVAPSRKSPASAQEKKDTSPSAYKEKSC